MTNTQDLSHAIVKAVLRELKGRGGFDHWWDDIDPDIKREIEQDLTAVVVRKML